MRDDPVIYSRLMYNGNRPVSRTIAERQSCYLPYLSGNLMMMPGNRPVAVSREEIDALLKLQFYVKDDELQERMDEWREWCMANAPETKFSFSSASYSGFRYVTFLFEQAEEAALFRLMFGGKLVVTEP